MWRVTLSWQKSQRDCTWLQLDSSFQVLWLSTNISHMKRFS